MQQTDYWLPVIFSGIAAVGGAGGGVFSAIYSASFTRRKAERELLAGKLETLYSELKDESCKRIKAIEVVEREVQKGPPAAKF